MQAAIVDSAELADVDKSDALEQIRVLVEASKESDLPTMQRAARLAIKLLWGTTLMLPTNSSLVEVSNRCLPLIMQQFTLDQSTS